jgi:hypothetical protein
MKRKKHIVAPATAAEICKAVGATKEDHRIVNEVLRKLKRKHN